MNEFLNQITGEVAPYIPRIFSALMILIIGWIVALLVGAIVRGALKRTTLDNRLAAWLAGEKAQTMDIEGWTGKCAYYLVMLFVLVSVFQTLGLTIVTEPLNGLLNQVFAFAPRILSAGLLLAVAWILATGLRALVTRALAATTLDERLAKEAGHEGAEDGSVSHSIARFPGAPLHRNRTSHSLEHAPLDDPAGVWEHARGA